MTSEYYEYTSGAVHAKEHITVTAGNSYSIYGEFSAPTARGTWPAFWWAFTFIFRLGSFLTSLYIG